MKPLRLRMICLLAALLPGAARAQQPIKEAVVMFKDGFYVRGFVHEKRDFIVDPASGQTIPIAAAGGFMYVDDRARRIHFDPNQVGGDGVIELKAGELQGGMELKRYPYFRRRDVILPGWTFDSISPWGPTWHRTIKVDTHFGSRYKSIDQRILTLSPLAMQVLTVGYDWDLFYLTQELGPELLRGLVYNFYKDKKEMKEPDRLFQVAQFLQAAGWPEAAEKELDAIIKEHPEASKNAKEMLQAVHELRAGNFVDEINRAAQLGQHQTVQDRVAVYERQGIEQVASAKHRLVVQDIKSKYETSRMQLEEAKRLLKALPPQISGDSKAFWTSAVAALSEELNLDILPRLELFLSFAAQHERELNDKAKPAQSTDEVLALAITGWLQGNQAAEPDAKMAQKLLQARKFLLDYLKRDSPVARNELLSSFAPQNDLPLDVLARLIRLVPPAHAQEKLGTEPINLTVEVPEADATKYIVQLPPDYSHARPHPVLFLLHGAREQPEVMMQRWQEQAAKYGFILVAPHWSKGLRASYEFSPREHRAVLDVLRDLRRRFQIDSDRVFLFGWEQGATMAFDVGLSHPDQFAGVLPMNGAVMAFPARYWSNAQYLPFYIVEGDRNGGNPKATRGLYKDWIRGHYASLYIEYKGRSSEWYAAELPMMMNWMSRKKRLHPLKQVGRHHTSGSAGSGEEFKTMRQTDNRFYWLSTDDVSAKHLNEYPGFSLRVVPATLQADLGVGNELDKKGANIWSQFNIRTSGVKQVSLWLEAGLIDFSKPVRIRLNGDQVGADRIIPASLPTLLEELAFTGDRQRLFFAKVDLRLR